MVQGFSVFIVNLTKLRIHFITVQIQLLSDMDKIQKGFTSLASKYIIVNKHVSTKEPSLNCSSCRLNPGISYQICYLKYLHNCVTLFVILS